MCTSGRDDIVLCVGSQGLVVSAMWMLVSVAFFVVLNGATSRLNKDELVDTNCSTWTIYNPQLQTCTCGTPLDDIVTCYHVAGGVAITMLSGFCMTLNKDQTETVLGSCPFSFRKTYSLFFLIPQNLSQLNKRICGLTQRTGQLCGCCVNGTSPPVYSYYPQCVNCTTNNWPRYLTVSLLPTTVFFIGALALRLRVTSPHMNGFILVCQIITSPPILRNVAQRYYVNNYTHNYIGIAGDICCSFFSIWNLDFFRMAYSPFCLHPNASTLQILSLDYIIAAYPLALIILTYTLVTLHYHNCRLVVCLWKPFLKCCIHFRRQWNIQTSLVDAFATFLLLSYVKFLSVSFDILTPTFMYNKMGRHIATVLYYDGHVQYFDTEHLPFALLAITVLLVFTFLPILLLCLYPCRWFQKLLNSYHLRSQALHTFMDAFQGCYKDGTNGTRDCRYFAAIYLIARVAVYLSMMYSLTANNSILVGSLVIVIVLLSGFSPYKEKLCNHLDIFLLGNVVVLSSSPWLLQAHNTERELSFDRVILHILALILVTYSLSLLFYCIWRRSRWARSATERIRTCFSRPASQPFAQSLPRRVVLDEASALLRSSKSKP